MSSGRTALPIREIEPSLVAALRGANRLVLEAPTGSGKSTQVPQMILDAGLAGRGRIVVLQPRRLAARLLSRWVAVQRGVPLGGEVGYQVRFENRTGRETRIVYETDGLLLRQFAASPDLDGVGVIVFDEFHERHVFGDVMLALALRLQATRRPDLKVVVMSATLDSRALEAYLEPCTVLRSEGRAFPVAVEYLGRSVRPDREAVWDVAAREFDRLVRAHGEGDVLVFMPGAYEIRRTLDAIGRTPAARGARLLPLHGELGIADQDAAVERYAERKVVVATNVAETSVTIDGIRLVIDSGLARKARFDPHRGINTLLIEPISRASAEQRAGRAGRTAPGLCLRLWSEAEHAGRPAHDPPEIRRVDLAEVLLALKAAGIGDPAALHWLDPPAPAEMERALALLTDLGALHPRDGGITPLGRRLQAFPLHPRQARMLVEADAQGCVGTVALIAALSQERDLFLPAQNRDVIEKRERTLGEETRSDLLLLQRAWEYARQSGFDPRACGALGIGAQTARSVQAALRQILSIAEGEGLDVRDRGGEAADAVRRCVLAGFSDQLGCALSAGSPRYALVHGRRGTLDKASAARGSELIVAAEIHEIGHGRGDVEVRLSHATVVERDWLAAMYPDDLRRERVVAYDATSRRVEARERLLFRDLVIEERRGAEPTPAEAAGELAQQVANGTLTLKEWDHRVEQWIGRVNLLAAHCPELGIPAIAADDRRTMVEQICLGAIGYKDIKEKPVWPVVRAWLSPAQQALVEQHAPERVTLANGRTPRVVYEPGQAPHIAVRIQELFGVNRAVTVALGRVTVTVHILAPNQRTVQITDDLRSFWANAYPALKRELQRRYPKHEWR